jgi:AraC-like DNA-binding protein
MMKNNEKISLNHSYTDFTYKIYSPCSVLKPFVGCYWISKQKNKTSKPELMIPDGYIDLIFSYGESYSRAEFSNGLDWQKIDSSHIVGGRHKSVLINNNANLDLVGVKLTHYGLWCLTQQPSAEFLGRIIPLDLLAPFFAELEQQVYDAADDNEKICVLEKYLSRKLLPFADENAEIQFASQMILNSNGDFKIEELCRAANLSYKNLERSFDKFIGMSPKSFARIIRFKKTLQFFKANYAADRHLYLDFGYYDQNHFIKDFKQFMGGTPSAYYKGRFHAEDKFFTLGTTRNFNQKKITS